MDSERIGDLVAFSHLRWDWVYQRPQHLLTRAARDRRVFYVEEPVFGLQGPVLQHRTAAPGVTVVTPLLPHGLSDACVIESQRLLLDAWMLQSRLTPDVLWYYTPLALAFTGHLDAPTIVYDCMDELSAFRGAPSSLQGFERMLLQRADVVFTGGLSLFEAKRGLHHNVHAMPSCVDIEHFRAARGPVSDHPLQAHVPFPRIGYCGVIDERLDVELVGSLAAEHPEWQFVLAGPVCKIDPATLPVRPNVHWLGPVPYTELPQLLAHWNVGWMPFALNDATRYISPTKTPEYLAAGLPVVSSAIRDVVRTWGNEGYVSIAGSRAEFAAQLKQQVVARPSPARLARIDRKLAFNTWNALWSRMEGLLQSVAVNAA